MRIITKRSRWGHREFIVINRWPGLSYVYQSTDRQWDGATGGHREYVRSAAGNGETISQTAARAGAGSILCRTQASISFGAERRGAGKRGEIGRASWRERVQSS